MRLYISDTFEGMIVYTALRGVALKNTKHIGLRILNNIEFNYELKMLANSEHPLIPRHVWVVDFKIEPSKMTEFQQLLANNSNTKFLVVTPENQMFKGVQQIFKNFKHIETENIMDIMNILKQKKYDISFLPKQGSIDYYKINLAYREFGFREASDQILVPCNQLLDNLVTQRKKLLQQYSSNGILQKEKICNKTLLVGAMTDCEDITEDLKYLNASFILLIDNIYKVYCPLVDIKELYQKISFIKEFHKVEVMSVKLINNIVCVEIKNEIKFEVANTIMKYLYNEIKEIIEFDNEFEGNE